MPHFNRSRDQLPVLLYIYWRWKNTKAGFIWLLALNRPFIIPLLPDSCIVHLCYKNTLLLLDFNETDSVGFRQRDCTKKYTSSVIFFIFWLGFASAAVLFYWNPSALAGGGSLICTHKMGQAESVIRRKCLPTKRLTSPSASGPELILLMQKAFFLVCVL